MSEPDKSIQFRTLLQVSDNAEEAALTEFAIAHLSERGYYVARPDEPWEKNGAFCKRVGLYPHRIREAIERYKLRGGPPIRVDARGESGRIVSIQSNPHFDNFCRSIVRGPRNAK